MFSVTHICLLAEDFDARLINVLFDNNFWHLVLKLYFLAEAVTDAPDKAENEPEPEPEQKTSHVDLNSRKVVDFIQFNCSSHDLHCTAYVSHELFISPCLFLSPQFLVEIKNPEEEGLYNLYFHNCGNFEKETGYSTNLTVSISLLFNDLFFPRVELF
jgi:hypothetical protein